MGPMIWGGGVMAVASAKCRVHPREPAIGYCTRCGSFGCSRCLLTCVDENLYCLACIRKLQLKVAEAASESRSARSVHLKLVVRLKNGKMLKGTSYKLDPTSKGFPLIPVMGPKAGELVQVLFEDVKSVYHVREFASMEREGAAAGADERMKRRGGQEITIRYSDGEVLRGYPSGTYRPDQSRFWVIPLDAGNNISILVERSATFSIELGKQLASQGMDDLVSTPLRRSLLAFYRANSSLIETAALIARRLGAKQSELEETLEPFFRFKLIRKIKTPTGEQLEFLPPLNRALKDFVRSHVSKEARLKVT